MLYLEFDNLSLVYFVENFGRLRPFLDASVAAVAYLLVRFVVVAAEISQDETFVDRGSYSHQLVPVHHKLLLT